MNDLVVKAVDFNGAELMAVQDKENGKIYVGVSWVCRGIGFSKNQKDSQVEKVQVDVVLQKGCRKFPAGVFDSNNEALAIELEYLPLWLAKIPITTKMQKEQADVSEHLIEYQLKAKNALVNAFVQPLQLPNTTPKEEGAGEAASLLKITSRIMERQKSEPHEIAAQAKLIFDRYNIPTIPNFVKIPLFEQLQLTVKAGDPA